jgi:hypothetical protein
MKVKLSHPLAAYYPLGSKVRIIKDSSGLGRVELFDTYTVVKIQDNETIRLRDNLGTEFRWRVADCIHPGLDTEWIQRSSSIFAKGSPARLLLRAFIGKRFLRLRPEIRDRILLQQPDLKQRILELITALNS